MRKIIILLSVFFLFLSCEIFEANRKEYIAPASYKSSPNEYSISVIKHPDINFPETDPDSVKIYEGFKPFHDEYFTIGGIAISGKELLSYEAKKELKEKAAEIGGHALIMVDVHNKTWESSGGITGISIPRYFWWDRPYYIGTDYYFHELPKITYTSHSIIYIIVKFNERSESEALERIKKKYPCSDPKQIMEMWNEKDEEGNHKYNLEDLQKIIIQDYVDVAIYCIKKNQQEYKATYNSIDLEEVKDIMLGIDQINYYLKTGKFKYKLSDAIWILFKRNLNDDPEMKRIIAIAILRTISLVRFI